MHPYILVQLHLPWVVLCDKSSYCCSLNMEFMLCGWLNGFVGAYCGHEAVSVPIGKWRRLTERDGSISWRCPQDSGHSCQYGCFSTAACLVRAATCLYDSNAIAFVFLVEHLETYWHLPSELAIKNTTSQAGQLVVVLKDRYVAGSLQKCGSMVICREGD